MVEATSDFISLKGITKTYGEKLAEPVYALRGIDLDINDGDFISIMGPSGCGKSTLMNIVGLLDVQSSGSYFLRRKEVKNLTPDQQSMIRRTTIGFIFQGYNLLKRMAAREQVVLPLSYMGVSSGEAKERAYEALKLVGLDGREKALPNQLSGGQQQRVCIARALVTDSALLLADEPTGALDSKTGIEIMQLLKNLNTEKGKTILLITHDANVSSYANKTIRIKDGVFI
ncbi:MAG: ABC transporter ATP-binding protein [candidate division SR1 bacterium]|nr:ABC transporter ATP-binding protein [candidate division SR1 bacterium]